MSMSLNFPSIWKLTSQRKKTKRKQQTQTHDLPAGFQPCSHRMPGGLGSEILSKYEQRRMGISVFQKNLSRNQHSVQAATEGLSSNGITEEQGFPVWKGNQNYASLIWLHRKGELPTPFVSEASWGITDDGTTKGFPTVSQGLLWGDTTGCSTKSFHGHWEPRNAPVLTVPELKN